MTRLRFAQNDADALVKLFETQRHGDFKEISIHPFPARGPTRDEILDALKNLKSQPNDTLVVSLSGHGIVRDNEYFYMTSDARKNDLKTALSGTDLIEALYRVPATKIFLILDTCQAEGIKTGLAVVDKSVRKQGIPVIYAAGHHDEAKETEKLGHGLLTYSLLYSVRAAEGKFGDPDLRLAGQLVDSTNWSRSSIDIAQKILRDNFGQDVPTVNHITGSQFPLLFLK